jgi:sortase A
LRIVGLTALTAAAALGGFVAWQLWITNIQAGHAQDRLADEFVERAQAAVYTTAAYDPGAFPSAPIVIPASLEEPAGLDSGGSTVTDQEPPPDLIVEKAPALGQPIGEILIPEAGIDWVVVEGGRPSDLTLGAGHMPWTPLPGQPGNAVISGHRTTHGAPFRNLDRVAPGDIVSVETTIGLHVYEVVQTTVIDPEDTWVMDQWRGAWLTLTTCHPAFSATQRLVVIARLIDGPNAEAILGR